VLQRLEHLLGIEDLTREQISFILDQAKPFLKEIDGDERVVLVDRVP